MTKLRLVCAGVALAIGLSACGETAGTQPQSSLTGVQQQSAPSINDPSGSYPAPGAASPDANSLSVPSAAPDGSYPAPSTAP